MVLVNDLKGLAIAVSCPKCGATTHESTACAYPSECFHNGRITADGLHAVRNRVLKQWEYFRLTPDGYVKTGSTKRFEY